MRRALVLAVAALLLVPAGSGARRAHVTAVGVGLREFQLAPYRDRVRPGIVKLNINNFGEDPHDVVVRTRGGRIVARVPELGPGARRTSRVRIKRPGRYVLFCSIADHEALGMKARLRVTRKARR